MNYNKQDIDKIIEELKLDENIKYEEIPSIDLYMDQVITLFENNLQGSKRNEKDKILTKTMINNYAKDKLFMPVKNKKYSREHIILMILIYALKQNLSISDIKALFTELVLRVEEDKDSVDLEKIYKAFLKIKESDEIQFKKSVEDKFNIIEDQLRNLDKGENNYEGLLLLVLSLINSANMYKRLAESIIDECFSEEK